MKKTPPVTKRRVLVVDDHPLIREGLVRRIAQEPDLELFGEVGSVGETILAVDSDPPPDLIILDLMLGNADGLELIKQVRALRPVLPILVISVCDEMIYAERALRAGAGGFIMKNESSDAMLAAARAVLNGELYLSGRMQVLLAEKGLAPEPSRLLVPGAKPPLSDRELHVFRLIGAGMPTRDVAAELHLIKLRLKNAAELVASAKAWVDQRI